MNKLSLLLVVFVLFLSCGKSESESTEDSSTATEQTTDATDASSYDPKRGEGSHAKR